MDFEPLKEIHGGPAVGRILVTAFHNPWTSLIRFDVGDLVRLYEEAACPCGRDEGLMLKSIEGRSANATFTTGGRLVTIKQLDDVLSAFKDLRDYHLDQISKSEYNLKIITLDGKSSIIEKIIKEMHSLYGKDAAITVELCDEILPAPAGKYRRAWAHFDFDIKELLV